MEEVGCCFFADSVCFLFSSLHSPALPTKEAEDDFVVYLVHLCFCVAHPNLKHFPGLSWLSVSDFWWIRIDWSGELD